MEYVYCFMAAWLFIGWIGAAILTNKVASDKGTDLGKVVAVIGLGPITLLASFLAERKR